MKFDTLDGFSWAEGFGTLALGPVSRTIFAVVTGEQLKS